MVKPPSRSSNRGKARRCRKVFFALKGQNINSPGQNDEGVAPRVRKIECKPSVRKPFSKLKPFFGRNIDGR